MVTKENFCEMKVAEKEQIERLAQNPLIAFERKYDGTAAILDVNTNEDRQQFVGRGVLDDGTQQNYTDVFPELMPSVNDLIDSVERGEKHLDYKVADFKFVGEIVNFDENGNDYFKGIEKRCNRKKDRDKYAKEYPAHFVVFDVLDWNGHSLEMTPFGERRNILEELNKHFEDTERMILIPQLRDEEAKIELVKKTESGECGIEGIVAKGLDAPYGRGVFKYKYKDTYDVFWEGEYKPGNGRHEGRIGALICYQYINGVKTHVADVGGGLTDKLRDEFTILADTGQVSASKPMVFAIQAHEVFPTGKMRYPNYVATRFDKAPSQCVGYIGEKVKKPDEHMKSILKMTALDLKPKAITQSLDDWI